jgi:predicted nucleic acid-binding protein
MRKTTAFCDASALVPLCVHETTSPAAYAQLRMFLPVVWWGTLVEIHRAIRRAHLTGKLNDREMAKALFRLDLLSRGWREILPGDAVRDSARQLLDGHDLRAADSLQLAAALVWCQQRSTRKSFLSSDRRLLQAARDRGFSVVEFQNWLQ